MQSHDEIWKEQGDESVFQTHHIIHFIKHFKSNKFIVKVLDIGCGPGADSLVLAKRGYDVYAVDLSPTAVEMCKQKLIKFPELRKNINERVLVHNINRPYPFSEKMDSAISFSVLHHNTPKTLDKCLRNVYEILDKRGLFFVSVVCKEYLKKVDYQDPKFGELFKYGGQFWAHKKDDIYYPVYDDKIGNLTKERRNSMWRFKPVYHIFFDEKNIMKYFGGYFCILEVRREGIMLLISMKKK